MHDSCAHSSIYLYFVTHTLTPGKKEKKKKPPYVFSISLFLCKWELKNWWQRKASTMISMLCCIVCFFRLFYWKQEVLAYTLHLPAPQWTGRSISYHLCYHKRTCFSSNNNAGFVIIDALYMNTYPVYM